LGTPECVAEPMRKSKTNCERCLGSYWCSFGGLHALSEMLRICMINRLPSPATMMHGLLLIITSESYYPLSSLTLYFVPRNTKQTKDNAERLQDKPRYTVATTELRIQKISIKHDVDGICCISHLIMANECRNTPFINSARKLEALLLFTDYSFLVNG
jgi:hypothetical protein